MKQKGFKNAIGKPCHFSKLNQVKELREWVETKFGRLDVLVNNAATSLHFGPILETTEKAYDKMMNLNLKVIFLNTFLCQKKSFSFIGKDCI